MKDNAVKETKEKSGRRLPEGSKSYKPPEGRQKEWPWRYKGRKNICSVRADWLLIRKKEKPVADIFYTYYFLKADHQPKSSSRAPVRRDRPLTFVFNGGPGASSAYLHVGAMAPRTIHFQDKGECPPFPSPLADNPDTWLAFTDLVFVDPVGAGFSRSLEEIDLSSPGQQNTKENESKTSQKEFYEMNRDMDSLCEFIRRFLSGHRRWSSPVFIAGESYGGFRVAKLSRKLQEDYGVGLRGIVLISPCLELGALMTASDYNAVSWMEAFPTMSAVAAYHRKSSYFAGREKEMELGEDLQAFLQPAERFAVKELSGLLLEGEGMEPEKREGVMKKAGEFTGVPFDTVKAGGGRLRLQAFCRRLLKKERKWCGLYDASITSYDPFPDRDSYEGPEPTLSGNEPAFSHGINTLLRERLELECDREYRLLNLQVFRQWKLNTQKFSEDLQIGAMDDLRYAMAMCPDMRVFICHGAFDLVTPYFSSKRLIRLMNLPEPLKKQIVFTVFHGGHMFYTWKRSRRKFQSHVHKTVYLSAGGSKKTGV